MISTSLLRQAVRAPTLVRAASTAAAAGTKPPYKRAYTRTTPSTSTYKRTTLTPASTAKPSPPLAAAEDAALPVVDAVPEEALPTPLAHTIDDILDQDPTPQLSPAQAQAGWSAVASEAFPSAPINQSGPEVDWTTSFHGLSAQAFSKQAAETLMRPLLPKEVEIKPDGILYLPEILYRRILNQAFGPGGWGMVPRGEMTVTKNMVSREWALLAAGRLVAVARGEQTFFDPSGVPTASEGCKSNALMRCCKDLGIASELWDPSFIRAFKTKHCTEAWVEHVVSKKKQRRWRKKENKFEYPYQDSGK